MAKSKYEIFYGWALLNGLILGILFTHNQDISETGILSTILKAMNEAIPISGYIWIQILLFVVGVASLIYQAIVIWQDSIETRVMAISCFLGIFLLIFGTGKNIEFLTNIGVIFFIISILVEGYLIASER